MDLISIAKRVRRGVRLLDKKIPNWRVVLRRHSDQYDFEDGAHCVLGTLEHYSGRMRVLKQQEKAHSDDEFVRAMRALGLRDKEDVAFGFNAPKMLSVWGDRVNDTEQLRALDAIWRSEFEE